ncbi:unnamed protein product [Effrenium voratum]|nr:unnamed protein product [Effrenium voratum]
MVHFRDDVVGLDSSIVSTPAVHRASGHVDNFSDPMVDCTESKSRFRADQLMWAKVELEDDRIVGYVSMVEDGNVEKALEKAAKRLKKEQIDPHCDLLGCWLPLQRRPDAEMSRADAATEAADDDVVPMVAVSDKVPVKKDKARLDDSRKKLLSCAKALRARLAKEQAEVWKKAEAEFNVQKMIWQSLSLQRGAKHQGTAAMIESKLEFAMQTHTQNLASAVEALDTCLERNQGLDLLGVAMADCIEAIKGATLHADAREELAKLLEKAAEELGSGVVSRRGADLIALLGDCGIQEPKLESAIKAAWVAAYEE